MAQLRVLGTCSPTSESDIGGTVRALGACSPTSESDIGGTAKGFGYMLSN